MSVKTKLTIDQRIQIARMATDIYMHTFHELTSAKNVIPMSRTVNTNNDAAKEERARIQRSYDWAFDLVASKVTDESETSE
ncbi:hypothetical protein [Dickeya zeae]|uniref:hypothetical protein n=1 Tax=Dickeya zeae TaxID=204042 RepID=UPI000577C8E3|nr:hypothetical protein [Dickeya zeae]